MPILSNNFIFTPPSPTTEQMLNITTSQLVEYVKSSFNQAVNFQRSGNSSIWHNTALSAQQIFDALSAGGKAAELVTYYEALSVFIRATSTYEGVSAQLIEPTHGYVIGLSGTVTVVP
jgi:hypothetical protein